MTTLREDRARSYWRIIVMGIVVVILICGSLWMWDDARRDRAMRARLGFLAECGGVGATYEEVDAMMLRTFPRNMTQAQVIETLNSTFGCYRLNQENTWTGESNLGRWLATFPGTDCDCEQFHAAGHHCYWTRYDFYFIDGRLKGVSRQSS